MRYDLPENDAYREHIEAIQKRLAEEDWHRLVKQAAESLPALRKGESVKCVHDAIRCYVHGDNLDAAYRMDPAALASAIQEKLKDILSSEPTVCVEQSIAMRNLIPRPSLN